VRTLPERLAELIRHAIYDGSLAPGQPLRQADLAARFGVSRIPLREALRQLEAEGLVEFSPYRGAVVAVLLPSELEDLAEIRRVLDVRALRLACRNATPELVRQLEALLDARDRATDMAEWGRFHNGFYAALFAAAGRPHLIAWIAQIHAVSHRYFPTLLRSEAIRDLLQRGTRGLLDKVRRNDANGAAKLLDAYYREFIKLAVDVLESGAKPAERPQGRGSHKPGR
jgi:DNA-binding GntR family transcriptional regulator